VTNANSTVSAAFVPLFFSQFALTVMTSGSGQVTISPRANIYRQGQRVTLEAAPDAGQEFLGWTGDASGTLTNLLVVMDRSRVFTANFTRRPRLSLGTCLGGLSEDGFQLTLTGEYGASYEIDGSTTLIGWTAVATVTNLFGTVQFRDQTGTDSVALKSSFGTTIARTLAESSSRFGLVEVKFLVYRKAEPACATGQLHARQGLRLSAFQGCSLSWRFIRFCRGRPERRRQRSPG